MKKRAQGLIEYALLVVVIGGAIAGAATLLANAFSTAASSVAAEF
jgi:Flp pilus assembly pilin Flp